MAGRAHHPPPPPPAQQSAPGCSNMHRCPVAALLPWSSMAHRGCWHRDAATRPVELPAQRGVLSCVPCGGPILGAVYIPGACCICLWGHLLCGILSRPFVGVSLTCKMPGRCAVVRGHMQTMWGHEQRVQTCLRVQTCAVLELRSALWVGLSAPGCGLCAVGVRCCVAEFSLCQHSTGLLVVWLVGCCETGCQAPVQVLCVGWECV